MKNTLNILMLATGLFVMQSCGSKKNSEAMAENSVEQKEVALTAAEKRAAFEKQREERAEKRRIAYEKLAMTTPSYTDANGNVVYNKAESDPVFAGGKNAMTSYLKENLKFPQDALDKQEEGIVFVDFVIAKNGTVREVEVTDQTNENIDPAFRSEAARVVSAMPKWTPGLQHGKAVDVKFSLPISFELR